MIVKHEVATREENVAEIALKEIQKSYGSLKVIHDIDI